MTREQRDAAAETVGRLRKRARLFERLLDSCRREWKNTNDPDVLADNTVGVFGDMHRGGAWI